MVPYPAGAGAGLGFTRFWGSGQPYTLMIRRLLSNTRSGRRSTRSSIFTLESAFMLLCTALLDLQNYMLTSGIRYREAAVATSSASSLDFLASLNSFEISQAIRRSAGDP